MICDYDFFRLMYQTSLRQTARTGIPYQLALITLEGKEESVSHRSLETALDQLLAVLRTGLRAGDVVTRYSFRQIILLLPNTSAEDAGRVCERLYSSFRRLHSHAPVRLLYEITSRRLGDCNP